MQRFATFLSLSLVSGFALTGCPEKKAEKEEPATPDMPAVADQAEEKKAEEAKPAEAKPEEKKAEPAGKEEGGW